ncbi:MAG: hypothetical protein GY797_02400 [Deltaproteobacteria bacterium]|nr:hypothetical protein [Deltaproteobacteria bacterium]
MERKGILILLVIIIVPILLLIWWFWPIKKAVKIRPSNLEEGVFLCARTAITGIDWELILEPSQKKLEGTLGKIIRGLKIEYVALEGNTPFQSFKGFMGWSYQNKYLLKGHFLDKRVQIGNDEYMRVIWVDEWDIVFPVYREDFWGQFLPKRWLTPYDFHTIP